MHSEHLANDSKDLSDIFYKSKYLYLDSFSKPPQNLSLSPIISFLTVFGF